MANEFGSAVTGVLKEQGVITDSQLAQAQQRQREEGGTLEDALINMGLVTPMELTHAYARLSGRKVVDLSALEISPSLLELVPQNVARKHNIIPIDREDGTIVVAASRPLDYYVLDNLRFILDSEIEYVLASAEAVQENLGRFYGNVEESVDTLLSEFTDSEIARPEGIMTASEQDESDDAPIVRLVQLIISEAVKQRASDIHVEPMENRLRIRYRVDGVCHEVDSPPKRLQGAILSRVKIMAGMDITERRVPLDGRIQQRLAGKDIDLRVSSLPCKHGESIVMRILDRESVLVDIESLGFDPSDYERFNQIIRRPNGIFLVTGPTGSGKTTTLYSALNALNRPDTKIITAEDPVEYTLPGINQAEVREEIGLGFSKILRSMLRQAPEIILVGEIRDFETAEIAIQAALTGHLVFSTLHTNDAPSAITRLIDMGIKPFLVSSSVMAIMAQRLVRVICSECKEPVEADPATLKGLGMTDEQIATGTIYHGRGEGCRACGGTGYHGRKGIFELMEMTHELRGMAFNSAPVSEVRRAAAAAGMISLRRDAIRKLLGGVTTLDEVIRITQAGEM